MAALLDEAKTDLTGAEIVFSVTIGEGNGVPEGRNEVPDAATLLGFNRALAARVAAYREQWPAVLTALNESFFDLNGSFASGFYHVYSTGPNAPVPIIRNEELTLLYAEAKIHIPALPDAMVALNRIRTQHNLSPYAGGVSQNALINEMLFQRRYSLFFEGHRWVDMRRYVRLNDLPKDRPEDDVFDRFPRPLPVPASTASGTLRP